VSLLSWGDVLHFLKRVFSIPQGMYDHSLEENLFILPQRELFFPRKILFLPRGKCDHSLGRLFTFSMERLFYLGGEFL
jgi:hypothetical protein